jgi:type IV secretory pathway VirJ component
MIQQLFYIACLLLSLVSYSLAAELQESEDSFEPFGKVHIYKTSGQPKHFVLFISGDGGWNLGVVGMAKALVKMDSMVAGIDITHYIKKLDKSGGKCSYSAAHFEALSQYLQKKYSLPNYLIPILAGYSSGATMVYTTLAQAPVNTFAGGISLGFCPDLKTAVPMCKGNGPLVGTPDPKLGFIYSPVSSLKTKLYVLQGDIDKVCNSFETKAFLGKVKNAELVELPRVGHGFSVQKNWMPQFRDVFEKISGLQTSQGVPAPTPLEIRDLPLVELPATGKSDTLAVVVSGDGGWASIDKQVAEALNKDGIAVVGLNSLSYFWKKKSPDTAGNDLVRILKYYGKAWSLGKFLVIGYSRGADTLPFMVNRLPDELKARVGMVALLGLDKDVDFEFRVSDWLSGNDAGKYQVVPEVKKLAGMNVLCIYGKEETESACKSLDKEKFKVMEMAGGHHYDGAYDQIAQLILRYKK